MGPWAGLDRCGKSRPHRDSIPERPALSSVAIPTELPGPPGKTRYPLYRRLGGPQGRCGRAENIVPTGIRSRTFQHLAQSLYRLSYPAHVRIIYNMHIIYNHYSKKVVKT